MNALDRRLLRCTRGGRIHLAVVVLIGLVTAALAIAQAQLLAEAISRAFLGRAGLPELRGTLVALALVLGARAVLGWAGEVAAQRAAAGVKAALRRLILARALELGPRWAADRASADVVTLATRGVDALDAYFGRYVPQVALTAIVPVAVVLSVAMADPIAALTIGLTVPILIVLMILAGRAARSRRQSRWLALSRLACYFLDVVAGLPTLKLFGRAHAQIAALERITDDYRRETMGALRIAFLSAFSLEFFGTLSVALVAVGVGLRLVAGDLDLRTGLFVLVLAPEAYLPIRQLGLHFHASEEGRAAARAAFAIVDAEPARMAAGPPARMPGLEHGFRLRVEDASIRQPGRDLLAPAGASLDVGPGEIVAVTGPSGAGKSSLLLAIAGLVPLDAGRITVAATGDPGVDVAALEPAAWRSIVAWLPQEPFLFAGSVGDNVRFGARGVSDAEVRGALAIVGLGDVDPDRSLAERGVGLSSGQRRRIGLARVLARHARVLLLDEPTAGLDVSTERRLLAAIRALTDEHRTAVILVAHRPEAVAAADRVVAVDWRAEQVA